MIDPYRDAAEAWAAYTVPDAPPSPPAVAYIERSLRRCPGAVLAMLWHAKRWAADDERAGHLARILSAIAAVTPPTT